jgi:hypothetical protein
VSDDPVGADFHVAEKAHLRPGIPLIPVGKYTTHPPAPPPAERRATRAAECAAPFSRPICLLVQTLLDGI